MCFSPGANMAPRWWIVDGGWWLGKREKRRIGKTVNGRMGEWENRGREFCDHRVATRRTSSMVVMPASDFCSPSKNISRKPLASASFRILLVVTSP